MRLTTKLTAAAAVFVLATATAAPQAAATPSMPTVSALRTIAVPTTTHAVLAVMQDAKIDIKVSDDTHSGAWYTQPVWIVIGIVALVLIILLIVSAGRRDTTTVVK
jgi:hypothetical protein